MFRFKGPSFGMLAALSFFFAACSGENSDDNMSLIKGGDSSSPTSSGGKSSTGGTSEGGGQTLGGDGGQGASGGGPKGDIPPLEVGSGWPKKPNEYSWDGSWEPQSEPQGLYDSIYFDAHDVEGAPSPRLPPGLWDWEITSLLASWRGFSTRVGTFDLLSDTQGMSFGWRLQRVKEEGVQVDAVMEVFYGSAGTDIIDLGPQGSVNSTGNPQYGKVVGLGDGPDMLRYVSGHSASIRLGSSATGSLADNDLALIGSPEGAAEDVYDVVTTAIHTGPGSDLVFVNNFERAAIDLGNGEDARTDSLDPQDGADIVVIGKNARDFRVFGGRGDDLFVWHVDEVKSTEAWLGPNFFGGGGWGDALWADEGIDRLVLNIPQDTLVVTRSADLVPGSLLMFLEEDQKVVIDTPTEDDPYARYYVYVPPSSSNRRTMTLQYISADNSVNTGYFFVTAVEEVQIGIDRKGPIYRLDDITGEVVLDPTLQARDVIPSRAQYEGVMNTFLR